MTHDADNNTDPNSDDDAELSMFPAPEAVTAAMRLLVAALAVLEFDGERIFKNGDVGLAEVEMVKDEQDGFLSMVIYFGKRARIVVTVPYGDKRLEMEAEEAGPKN